MDNIAKEMEEDKSEKDKTRLECQKIWEAKKALTINRFKKNFLNKYRGEKPPSKERYFF